MKNLILPPINRTLNKWWRHKLYSKSIKIKRTPKSYKIIKALSNACSAAQICMRHKFEYALYELSYRLYRRGKNRCLRCGVILNVSLL